VGTYAAWLYSTTRAAFQPLGCESELKASICKILPNHNFRDGTEGLVTMILPPLTVVHICAYTELLDYEWDPDKAIANFNKHGVHFSDAVSVLEDELALTVRDPYSDEEERWITLGYGSTRKTSRCGLYVEKRINSIHFGAARNAARMSGIRRCGLNLALAGMRKNHET
jgi:uncharacterized DUF497 family protein